jgi:hypothetical protein
MCVDLDAIKILGRYDKKTLLKSILKFEKALKSIPDLNSSQQEKFLRKAILAIDLYKGKPKNLEREYRQYRDRFLEDRSRMQKRSVVGK